MNIYEPRVLAAKLSTELQQLSEDLHMHKAGPKRNCQGGWKSAVPPALYLLLPFSMPCRGLWLSAHLGGGSPVPTPSNHPPPS